VISSLELEQVKDPNTWRELSLYPLASLHLELVAAGQTDAITQLLAPHRVLAPGLWQTLKGQGLELHQVHSQHSGAQRWLQLLGQPSTAMALPGHLLDTAPWRGQGLKRCPGSTPINEQLWLVLPEGEKHHNTLQETAEVLSNPPLTRKYL
jgi:hypothetical protein